MKLHPQAQKLAIQNFKTIEDRFNNIHSNKYNYDNSIYKNTATKIIVNCPKHKNFNISPNAHLSGKGCAKCASEKSRLTQKQFLEKSIFIHGNKYDYSIANYTDNRKKLDIICPFHGKFSQLAKLHLAGRGCGKCGNRNKKGWKEENYKDKRTTLYYIKIDNLYKIGLTVSSIKGRYSEDNIAYDILGEWVFLDGSEAYRIEQTVLEETKMFETYENILKSGNTELRTQNILNIIEYHLPI